MKSVILFISMCILFFACDSKQNQIELFEDIDLVYLHINQLDKQPGFEDTDKLASEIEQIFKENWKGFSNLQKWFFLSYDFYVGEDGTIQKMKRAKNWKQYSKNLPENYYQEIEPELLKKLEKIKFLPAQREGENVKFQSLLMIAITKGLEENTNCMVYLGFGKEPDRTLKEMYLNARSDFYIEAEKQPVPVGGIVAIQNNVKYPLDAKKAKIEGRVFIKAFIDEEGTVVKTEIIKGTDSSLDTAAANAVKLTKFIPGKQEGIPVKTQVAVPILFKLK